MSVSEKLMGLGSFSVTLKTSAPVETVETVESAGHILIFQQRVDPTAMSDDDMRAAAAYVGVVVSKPRKENLTVQGHGLIWWLGDGSGRGLILRGATSQDFVTESFNQAITDVLGVTNSPLNVGSVETPAGTFTQAFDLVTQRRAIEEICAAFGAEYRVNSDWTVDAGASGFLFVATPTVVIARHFTGTDPLVTGLPIKDLRSEQDIEQWIATAIVAAEGTGDTLQTAEDTVSPIPFKDPLGNDFNREMVFNSPSLPAGEAATRATELMEEFSVEEKIVKLNLADFHVSGDFEVGDLVYVWDTDHKLYDPANEVTFRGQVLNPIAIRVVGTQWRVIEGMGVLYRDKDGVYTDLTDHVAWERSTGTRLEVGASSRNLVNQESEALDARITIDPDGNDTLAPNAPAHSGTPWATSTYSDDEGARTSQIIATWTEPTNTDSSVVTDGSHYTIRWRRDTDTDYSYFSVPWGTEVAVVNGLVPGGIYEISVEAADVNGNLSGYATDETVTAAAQVGVPSTPAAPTVAGNTLNVQVSHDLTISGGGDLEDDLDHLVVYGDTSSGFTPSNANRLGNLMATKAHITLGITVIGTYPFPDTTNRFFVVTAINKAGGESAKSAEASVSATLIDTQHITDLAVTEAIIDDLDVARAKIALLAVDTAQIEALAVTEAKIDSLAVTNAKIGLLAVDTAQIDSLAVTNAKIGLLAVDTAQIATAAIETAKIDNLAVTNAKINDLNVSKLKAGTIDAEVITLTGAARLEIVQASGNIQLGSQIGGGSNDAGLSLSHTNFDNVFMRRLTDGVVFFKVNAGGANALTFDSSSGVLAITGEIHADTGTLTDLGIDGTLTMISGGVFRTATSGNRIEITASEDDRINLYTGDSFENNPGKLIGVVTGSGATRTLDTQIVGPSTTGDIGSTAIILRSESNNDATTPPGVLFVHTGGSSQTPEFRLQNSMIMLNSNGSAAAPSYSFTSDTNTGVWSPSGGRIGFALDATRGFQMQYSGDEERLYGREDNDYLAIDGVAEEWKFVLDDAAEFTLGITSMKIQNVNANFSGTGDDTVLIDNNNQLHINTSTVANKKYVKTWWRELAAIPLPSPIRYKSKAVEGVTVDPRWRYGYTLEDLVEADEYLVSIRDGKPHNYIDRALAALSRADEHRCGSRRVAFQAVAKERVNDHVRAGQPGSAVGRLHPNIHVLKDVSLMAGGL